MGEHATFLSTLPAKKGEWQLALAVVALSLLAFLVAAPFARTPLAPVAAFIPSYEAALSVNDLITAVLLIGQSTILRSRALLALASGYLFSALIAVPHALTFPGLFSPTGLLGAGPQSTAWLYMAWHSGFPLLVIAYVALKRREDQNGTPRGPMRDSLIYSLSAVAIAVSVLTWLTTAQQEVLPTIMQGNGYSATMIGVVTAVWVTSFIALLALWFQRSRTVLDVWLMVVMCAWMFDIALSAVLNGGRFDLGFYAGRIYGLLAASFVLMVLLLETRALYTRLIQSLAAERAEANRRAEALDESNRALRNSEDQLIRLNESLEQRVRERTRSLEQEIEERRRTGETLEALIQQSALGILGLNPERRVILWNPSAERIFGYSAAEILGQTYPLVPPGEQAESDGYFQLLSAGEHIQGMEVVRQRKDGSTITVVVSGTPLYDRDKRFRGVIFMFEDATDRKALEQQLRHAQKMEAIGQLTGGIAHDFNNLLAVIMGSVELLEVQLGGYPDLQDLARTAIRAGDRGATLTRSLLAFARRQPLEPKPLDIRHLIADMQELLTRSLGETIQIEALEDDDLWQCEVDPGELQNAVLNLAINARDAMPLGGKVTIETSNATLDADYAAQQDEVAPGQYVLLAVSDTGSGMPPEVIERAFDPFFTTKETGKGTGLGLSMVYGFIKQSRGHVKIYSELGHGTTVKLYLPRSQEALAAAEQDVTPTRRSSGAEKILVVEDDPEVLALTVRLLGTLDYGVVAAASIPEALDIIADSDDIDLLLTDVILPGGANIRQFTEQARTLLPDVKVLYMSGYTEKAILSHGRLDPGAHLLQKPFHKRELADKVRSVLDRA